MTRTWSVLGARVAQAVLVAFIVGTVSFFLMRSLPGDMAFRIAAGRYGPDMVTAASAEAVRTELNLNRPAGEALALWWSDLARLDLGTSVVTGAPIWSEIARQLGYTLRLAVAAFLLSALIGVPIGLYAGLHPGAWTDRVTFAGAVLIRTMPPFLIGLVLIILMSLQAGLVPAAGHATANSLFLPALTLALGLAAPASRVARDAMARVSASAYYEFARTKGLSDRHALWRHGIRNAATPIVAYLAVQLAFLIEGVVVVEQLFAWPGIGHALIHALFDRDVPMIQGVVLVMTIGFVMLNTVSDLIGLAIDPRRRAA
jgi:peptide/nickel transport system permease protein